MIIKFISFLIGVMWSYSIIKTQSVFNKKAGLIFKIFITKVSWFTLIAACYFGYKNFTIKSTKDLFSKSEIFLLELASRYISIN